MSLCVCVCVCAVCLFICSAMGMGGPTGPQDMTKIFAAEKNELEITSHDFAIPYAEQRLLTMPIPA